MGNYTIKFILIIFIVGNVYANSKLSGYLKGADTNKPLVGANVFILDLGIGAATDIDGYFEILGVSEGYHTIQISYISYDTKIIKDFLVEDGDNFIGNIVLDIAAIEFQSVNVLGAKKSDEASRINEQKKSEAVLSSISANEIRRSGDSHAGEALRRITGVSVTNEKNVVVRGLGDRYTETQVNGFNLASPEPDKKVVPLNLFPTSLIEKILVYKTYLVSLPGNFAGGNVSIETKSYPDRKVFSFKFGGSENSEFQSNKFQFGNQPEFGFFSLKDEGFKLSNIIPSNQTLGQYDYFNIDDETWESIFDEEAPSTSLEKGMYWNDYLGDRGSAFQSGFVPKTLSAVDPNLNISFNLGNKFELSERFEFGFFTSFTTSNKFDFNITESAKFSATDTGFQESAFATRNASSHLRRSALVFSTGLKAGVNKGFSLDWQTLITGYMNNSFTMSDGYDSNVSDGGYFFDEVLTAKQIASHRISSKIKLNESIMSKIQFNKSKSRLDKPDSKKHYYLREIVYEDLVDCNSHPLDINGSSYNRDDDGIYDIEIGSLCEGDDGWISWMGNRVWDNGEDFTDSNQDGDWGVLNELYTPYRFNGVNTGIRSFTSGGEDVLSIKFDNNFIINGNFKIDLGFSYDSRERDFVKREFYLDAIESEFWNAYEGFDAEEVPFGSIFDSGNYFGEVDNGLILIENTAGLARNAYSAVNNNTAGYVMSKYTNNYINITAGIRLEKDSLYLSPYNPVSGNVFISNIPPYDTVRVGRVETDYMPSINISIGELDKFRMGISKTKARPQFRELAPFEFQEYYSEEPVVGYPGLKSTDITNLDFRYEKYFSSSEIFSIALFLKEFVNPIEVAYIPSNDRAYKTYQNALDATSYGLEVEFRKNLRFIPITFGNASISLNGIYTESSVKSSDRAYLFNGSEIANNAANLTRPMQGQSDFVFNALINFKHRWSGIAFNMSYNTFSKRVSVVGIGDLVDEYELPYHLLNLQFKRKIFNQFEINLKLKNILNSNKTFGHIDSESGEVHYTKMYNPGTSYSLSVKINI